MNFKNLKEKQGITLIALIITIIVLLILAGISIAMLAGDNGILTRTKSSKQISEIAGIKEEIKTEIIAEQAGNEGNISESALKTILEKYGTINYDEDGKKIKSITTTKEGYEIAMKDIWTGTATYIVVADGSWNGTVNTPKIDGTGLTAVYWNGTNWIKLTSTSSKEEWNKWYDYSKQNWANAQSDDGSMWVWIPRYEYKIDSTKKTIKVNFVKIGDTTTDGYTLHPAFGTDIDNGGWSTDLPGFWVAKYAAGYQNATVGEETKTVQYSNLSYTELSESTSNFLEETLTKGETKISYPVFKANTYAYNIISVGDAWLLSQEIDSASMYGLSNVDSHMEKNSEWGAVAYLTHSQYGVNGNTENMNEITINNKNLNNSIYVNNASSGTKANVYAVTSYGNNNTPNDVNASSTKNMTGVFDLNGCVLERVAAFYQGGSASNPAWHSAMANSSTTNSTKYLTLYTSTNKKGDATKETSGWNSDDFNFVSSSFPVFERGGNYSSGVSAGVFAYNKFSAGSPNYASGFRVCLAF